jgi:hypothetical protein
VDGQYSSAVGYMTGVQQKENQTSGTPLEGNHYFRMFDSYKLPGL